MTSYRITLRDRATQTVVGYYDGSWTTDRCRALTLSKREAAEAHAARMRDRTPRNADLIKVEEFAAGTSASMTRFGLSGDRTETVQSARIAFSDNRRR